MFYTFEVVYTKIWVRQVEANNLEEAKDKLINYDLYEDKDYEDEGQRISQVVWVSETAEDYFLGDEIKDCDFD